MSSANSCVLGIVALRVSDRSPDRGGARARPAGHRFVLAGGSCSVGSIGTTDHRGERWHRPGHGWPGARRGLAPRTRCPVGGRRRRGRRTRRRRRRLGCRHRRNRSDPARSRCGGSGDRLRRPRRSVHQRGGLGGPRSYRPQPSEGRSTDPLDGCARHGVDQRPRLPADRAGSGGGAPRHAGAHRDHRFGARPLRHGSVSILGDQQAVAGIAATLRLELLGPGVSVALAEPEPVATDFACGAASGGTSPALSRDHAARAVLRQ